MPRRAALFVAATQSSKDLELAQNAVRAHSMKKLSPGKSAVAEGVPEGKGAAAAVVTGAVAVGREVVVGEAVTADLAKRTGATVLGELLRVHGAGTRRRRTAPPCLRDDRLQGAELHGARLPRARVQRVVEHRAELLAPDYVAPSYTAPSCAAPSYTAPSYSASTDYKAPDYTAPNYKAPDYKVVATAAAVVADAVKDG